MNASCHLSLVTCRSFAQPEIAGRGARVYSSPSTLR